MPETPSVSYGTQHLTLTQATDAILTRLLARLPEALWNTDPTARTLQRDLYHAIAGEGARWLESRTVATPMTLLLEAQGLDLDRLLRDYGLRRYMQRPDDYARQIGLHCLYIPKATEYAVRRLADLLLGVPHLTLVTGPGEVHTFVAETQPVTAPNTYWRLMSEQGVMYSVTVHYGLPICARTTPTGLDTTPGGQPLDWFTVRDPAHVPWYVGIRGDTFFLTQTPLPGHGTTAPFQVLDHATGWWTLSADTLGVLLTTVVTSASATTYWRLQSDGPVVAVYVEGETLAFNQTFPPGREETPASAPLDWIAAWDQTGALWNVTVEHGTFVTRRGGAAGAGSTELFQVRDVHSAVWGLAVETLGVLQTFLITAAPPDSTAPPSVPVLDPAHAYEACRVIDGAGTSWWLAIEAGAGVLWPALPPRATDVTPPGGPYRWLRLSDLQGQLWYGYPDTLGQWVTSLTTPGGTGTKNPTMLGDARGVQWHYGIDPAGVFTTSRLPAVTYGGLASTLILHDAQGTAWCWRVTNTSGVPFFEVSAALWEDAVATSPWGNLGWITLLNAVGATCYVYPSVYTGLPTVEYGPPTGAWWGWTEPLAFVDQQGTPYALSVDGTNVLAYTATTTTPDDIPLPDWTLSLRDFRDAMVHVRAQGTVVTLAVS